MCSSHQPTEGADSATVRNEAAERLRSGMPKPLHPILDEALAAERRATVKRIREAVRNAPRDEGPPVDRGSRFMVEVYRVLDEEAAR